MRLILHIGSPKTGTSSIQEAMHRNRTRLREAGVIYPEARGLNRHSIYAVPFLPSLPREFLRLYSEQGPAIADALALWAGVEKSGTVVLSGETFFDVSDFDGLRRQIDALNPARVDVVCYLRDPLKRYPSALQQIVKASSKLPNSLYKPAAGVLGQFGKIGNLIVREYGGNVAKDFIEGVVGARVKYPPRPANEGISAEGAQILQSFRRDTCPTEDNRANARASAVLAAIRGAEAEIGRDAIGKPELLPSTRRGIQFESRDDLQALSCDIGFRFADEGAYGPGERMAYQANMSVRDVLKVDPDRLSEIYRRVLSAL